MAESPTNNTEEMQFESEGDANSADSFEKQLQQQERELQDALRQQEVELEAKKAAAAMDVETADGPEPVAAPQPWANNTNGNSGNSEVDEATMEEAPSGEGEEGGVVVGVKRPAPEPDVDDATKQAMEEEEKQKAAKQRKIDDFDKLWTAATDNPKDFTAWTNLLQHVDQQSELDYGRQSYLAFFERYPYCYGYWKKFADLEKRKGTKESTMQVFERGLTAIPLSVDLWVHYMDYVTHNFTEPQEEMFIRQQFERAIENCGMEFKSDKIWDAFITWESSSKRWHKVTAVYDKLLVTPVAKYLTHWNKFQEMIRKHPANEVVLGEEYRTHKRGLISPTSKPAVEGETPDEEGAAAPAATDEGDAPPGVEDDGGVADGEEGGICQEAPSTEEENKTIQQLIIKDREKLHEKTAEEVKKRSTYEDAIKRPYFHVKPLERSQLQAWRDYLNFEIKQGDEKRTHVLFERCLIAAALYEEFWMRYIHYLEDKKSSDVEALRSVYARACNIHLKEKMKPHLNWAIFEEEAGNIDRALELLSELQTRLPDALEPHLQAIAVERRRGNLDKAIQLFEMGLETFQNKDKGVPLPYANLLVKYCRFMTLFQSNSDESVNRLKAVVDEHMGGENKPAESDRQSLEMILWALIEQAMACTPPNLTVAAEALKTGFNSVFPVRTRIVFSHRYLQFVSECGHPGVSLSEAFKTVREVKQEIRQQGASIEENGEENSADKTEQSESNSNWEQRREKRGKQFQQNSGGDKHYSHQGGQSGGQHNGNSMSGGGSFGGPGGGGGANYTHYPPPTVNAPPPHQPPQHPPPQAAQGGYGGYNQNYPPQGYPPQQQYQGWGYPQQQQQGYGYNQQGWGGYPNYYGQR